MNKLLAAIVYVFQLVISVLAFLRLPTTMASLTHFMKQLWQGLTAIVDTKPLAYLITPTESAAVLKQSAVTNLVFYAGTILFYNRMLKQASRFVFPALAHSAVEENIDFGLRVLLAAIYIYKNKQLEMQLVDAVQHDNAKLAKNFDGKHRGDITPDMLSTAELADRAQREIDGACEDAHSTVVLMSACELLPSFAHLPVRSYFFGDGLLHNDLLPKQSEANGINSSRMLDAKNIGAGLSMILAIRGMTALVETATGWENTFVDDAILGFIFHYWLFQTAVATAPVIPLAPNQRPLKLISAPVPPIVQKSFADLEPTPEQLAVPVDEVDMYASVVCAPYVPPSVTTQQTALASQPNLYSAPLFEASSTVVPASQPNLFASPLNSPQQSAAQLAALAPSAQKPIRPQYDRNEISPASYIRSIAHLAFWNNKATKLLSVDVPSGVKAIRNEKKMSVDRYVVLVKDGSSVFRGPETAAFYELVRQCYVSQYNAELCKEKIVAFVDRYLSYEDKKILGLASAHQPTARR